MVTMACNPRLAQMCGPYSMSLVQLCPTEPQGKILVRLLPSFHRSDEYPSLRLPLSHVLVSTALTSLEDCESF